MTLAHVNKYYLGSNLMAAPPSSQLDSLYADLQVHALSVSDGLSKVQAALGTDSRTTVMGRIDIDLSTAIRQQSTISWLQRRLYCRKKMRTKLNMILLLNASLR